MTLQWTPYPNGLGQEAPSTITMRGEALVWHLHIRSDDQWVAGLAPKGKRTVKVVHLAGSEADVKEEVQKVEDEYAGKSDVFPYFEVVVRWHLVGGGTVDEVVDERPEIRFHLGEMNVHAAKRAAKKLGKARRRDAMMKVFTANGCVARVIARSVTHFEVLQRDERRVEVPSPPGWPQHILAHADVHDDHDNDDVDPYYMVDHLLDMVTSYGDRRVEAASAPDGSAEDKAADAARQDIADHLIGIFSPDAEAGE